MTATERPLDPPEHRLPDLTEQDIIEALRRSDWRDRKGQVMRAVMQRFQDQAGDVMHEWAIYRRESTMVSACVEERIIDAIRWALDEYREDDDGA